MFSSRLAKKATCSICLLQKNKLIKFSDHSFNELAKCMFILQTVYLNDQQQTKELDDK